MAYDLDQQEASKDAENEAQGKSGYFVVITWPGGRCNRSISKLVLENANKHIRNQKSSPQASQQHEMRLKLN